MQPFDPQRDKEIRVMLLLKILISSLTAVFFIWIIPLGVFIKPSKEKLACNGRRAICLCSHLLGKAKQNSIGKYYIASASNASQKESSAGGANHDFILTSAGDGPRAHPSFSYHNPAVAVPFFYSKEIEKVPRA